MNSSTVNSPRSTAHFPKFQIVNLFITSQKADNRINWLGRQRYDSPFKWGLGGFYKLKSISIVNL